MTLSLRGIPLSFPFLVGGVQEVVERRCDRDVACDVHILCRIAGRREDRFVLVFGIPFALPDGKRLPEDGELGVVLIVALVVVRMGSEGNSANGSMRV